MADKVLKGSRMGHVSYESDRNHDLAPRKKAIYKCDNGEEFKVTFSMDAEIPLNWTGKNGLKGVLVEGELGANQEEKIAKIPRTHWDMLLERRSIAELEELLDDRMKALKEKRKKIT